MYDIRNKINLAAQIKNGPAEKYKPLRIIAIIAILVAIQTVTVIQLIALNKINRDGLLEQCLGITPGIGLRPHLKFKFQT